MSSSYKSPTSSFDIKERLKEENDGFKKKNSYENSYTPKYEKKPYQNFSQTVDEGVKTTVEKFRSKKQIEDPSYPEGKSLKFEKLDKYEVKSPYVAKTSTSLSSKKIPQPIKYTEVNNFILGKSLGEGKFGIVYQAVHKPTGWLYAVKKVPKQMIKSHMMVDQFILELKLQTFLNHENILTLFTSFDDKDSLYLVLQYMEEGTLFTHLKKNKVLP